MKKGWRKRWWKEGSKEGTKEERMNKLENDKKVDLAALFHSNVGV